MKCLEAEGNTFEIISIGPRQERSRTVMRQISHLLGTKEAVSIENRSLRPRFLASAGAIFAGGEPESSRAAGRKHIPVEPSDVFSGASQVPDEHDPDQTSLIELFAITDEVANQLIPKRLWTECGTILRRWKNIGKNTWSCLPSIGPLCKAGSDGLGETRNPTGRKRAETPRFGVSALF